MVDEDDIGFSLNPEEMEEGGGLLNDVMVTWEALKFGLFDYMGSVPGGVPVLFITLRVEGEEGTHEEPYTVGDKKNWQVSADGSKLIPLSEKSQINKGSKLGLLMASLINSGFPRDKLGRSFLSLAGLRCHMIQQPMPKQTGGSFQPAKKREDGRTFEKTILLVDKILALPGMEPPPKPPGKKAPAKKGAPAAQAPAEDTANTAELATETVLSILVEQGSITKAKLPVIVATKLRDKPAASRNAILELVFKDTFLGGEGVPWTYDAATKTLSM
jgi:hypothetical protein